MVKLGAILRKIRGGRRLPELGLQIRLEIHRMEVLVLQYHGGRTDLLYRRRVRKSEPDLIPDRKIGALRSRRGVVQLLPPSARRVVEVPQKRLLLAHGARSPILPTFWQAPHRMRKLLVQAGRPQDCHHKETTKAHPNANVLVHWSPAAHATGPAHASVLVEEDGLDVHV